MSSSTPPASAPARKEPLIAHPGRVATVVLLLGTVVTLGIWGLSAAETDTGIARNAPRFPSAIETLVPGPGELAGRQDTITIDLRDDLTGVMLIEQLGGDRARFEVPEDQLGRVVPLGQLSWRPGAGKELERLDAGNYRVTVLYWPQAKPRPETPSAFSWEFRVGV